jgi:hypothetical protein
MGAKENVEEDKLHITAAAVHFVGTSKSERDRAGAEVFSVFCRLLVVAYVRVCCLPPASGVVWVGNVYPPVVHLVLLVAPPALWLARSLATPQKSADGFHRRALRSPPPVVAGRLKWGKK